MNRFYLKILCSIKVDKITQWMNGKGISELVSFEIAKAKNINVVSREKRSEMLKEMQLSMTGLGDADQQVKVGKMLAAQYILSGNIINMGDNMIISLKMIEVETGKIVWQDKLTDINCKFFVPFY